MSGLLENHNKFVEVFCHNCTIITPIGCKAFYYPINRNGIHEDSLRCPRCQGKVFINEEVYLHQQKKIKVTRSDEEKEIKIKHEN